MSVEDTSVIDFVAQAPTGEVMLVAVEGRRWDGSAERLQQLQEKLNTYAVYALDGELEAHYPDLANKPVRIELRCVEAPDDKTLRLLNSARATLQKEGIEFIIKIIPEPTS